MILTKKWLGAALGRLALAGPVLAQKAAQKPTSTSGRLPPMGWNSWDCYGPTMTEAEAKANADYMAKHLKGSGWEYVVVDIPGVVYSLWCSPKAR